MSTTITLKGIPQALYERLKTAAQCNHRSLNGEVLACLESTLMTRRLDPAEQLAAIRAIQQRLPKASYSHALVDKAKRQGRA